MVKAVRIERKDGPEVLNIVDIDIDAPGEGEALVRHAAMKISLRKRESSLMDAVSTSSTIPSGQILS